MARLSWPIDDNGESSAAGAAKATAKQTKAQASSRIPPMGSIPGMKNKAGTRKGTAGAQGDEIETRTRSPKQKQQPKTKDGTAAGKGKGKASASAQDGSAQGRTAKRGKKRTSEAAEDASADDERAGGSSKGAAAAKTKRGRPSLDKNKQTSRGDGEQAAARKRSRSSLPSEQAGQSTKRRGGGQQHEQQQQTQQADPASTRPKKRRRKSDDEPDAGDEHGSGSESDGSPPPYQHLESRTRHITRSTIEDKWEPLDQPSIANVTALLGAAARPVLLRLRDMQKHTQATAVLNAVGNRLRNKLSRGMPFPPATTSTRREDELEFEKTIAGLEALEYQLDPLLHSVQLLRREKERAERELEREYKVLNRLSANARTAARERKDHLRKMHGLVPEPASSRQQQQALDSNTDELLQNGDRSVEDTVQPINPTSSSTGNAFAGLAGIRPGGGGDEEDRDKELAGLAVQIANHMDSLRGNLRQIDGVVPAVGQSQAALRARLLEHFDADVVDGVVLG